MSAESSTAQVLARRDDKYETETTRLSTSAPPLGRRGEAAGALRAEAADCERRELDSSGTCSTKRQVRDGDDKVAVNSAARLPRSGCWSSERAEAADFESRARQLRYLPDDTTSTGRRRQGRRQSCRNCRGVAAGALREQRQPILSFASLRLHLFSARAGARNCFTEPMGWCRGKRRLLEL